MYDLVANVHFEIQHRKSLQLNNGLRVEAMKDKDYYVSEKNSNELNSS